MRTVLFAISLFSGLAFSQAAMAACTYAESVSASAPEHIFKAGDCLWGSSARYILKMQNDGALALYDERHPGHVLLWKVAGGESAVEGSYATLKNDGTFVISDPSGKELWRAPVQLPTGTAADYRGDFFLTLGKSGAVEMFQGSGRMDPSRVMVWSSEGKLEADTNGDCQCHITNTNGSPGKASGDPFSTCGVVACLSTCKSKKDYFGDPLVSIYRNGTGKCRAF